MGLSGWPTQPSVLLCAVRLEKLEDEDEELEDEEEEVRPPRWWWWW